jgi:hypothetical protein
MVDEFDFVAAEYRKNKSPFSPKSTGIEQPFASLFVLIAENFSP